MLNVFPNSSLPVQTALSAPSPSPGSLNNPTATNGKPHFAQVVQDALDRTTSEAKQKQSTSSNSKDAVATTSTPAASLARSSAHDKKTGDSKQASRAQTQLTSNALAIAQVLVPPGILDASQVLSQDAGTVLADASEPHNPAGAVAGASSAQTGQQPSESPAAADGSIMFGSQLLSHLADAALNSPGAASVDTASPAGLPNPAESANAVSATSLTVTANPTSDSNAAGSTAGATVLVSQLPNPTTPPVPQTATVPSPVLQQDDVAPQISSSSPNIQQGQRLTSVLQDVAALQGASATPSSATTVAVDLSRMAARSQVTQVAEKTSLAASSLPHSLQPLPDLVPIGARAAQPNPIEANSTVAAQTASSATNHHPAGQDSSSNQGGQSAANSSNSSDSTAARLSSAKNQPSDFSDASSALSALKSDASQTSQTAGVPAQIIATTPQSTDPSTRAAQEPIPSAPPQSQSPLPDLRATDAPWGHSVSDAQLTNAIGQSEMRIALQTDKLGAIELHARVSGDQVGAAIIVEKRDAHAALAIEMPALQQALSDKQLRVDQVALTQGSLSSTTGDAGANAQQNQRGMAQPPPSAPFWTESRSYSSAAWFVPEQIGIFNAHGRLSVQA